MTEAATQKSKPIRRRRNNNRTRLWVRARFLGFRRSKVQQNTNQSILRIQGVNDSNAAQFYFGKRVVFICKSSGAQKDSPFRTIWGKVVKAHGNTGAVLARFATNLPPNAIGSTVRVMLYPQTN